MPAIFSLFFFAAASMDAIRLSVVEPKGSWRMTMRLGSFTSSWARTITFPLPSLYSETSTRPPVGKSGWISKGSFRRQAIWASMSSMRLCGRIRVAMLEAMPSAPMARRTGIFAGKATGSRFRPS